MTRITATVYIHGGDYDCSEAVRMCYRAVGVLPYGSYMWTGNEVSLLKENGFVEVNLNERLAGDVLWKEGHTEMYLGDGMQGGARIDETGGVHGFKQGDQTGKEICRSPYDLSYWHWKKCLRYVGPVTVDGIPAAYAACAVMNHLIDHDAHGYSQDNRSGDGTYEAVTIVYDTSPKPTPVLDVDGWVGWDTIGYWQQVMKTPVDNKITGQYAPNKVWFPAITSVRYDKGTGSKLIRAVQNKLGIDPDGVMGYEFTGSLQEWLVKRGYDIGPCGIDHVFGRDCGRALQESLNNGEWS